MASNILSLCENGVDGLFVTLPDDAVVEAVMKCHELNPNVQIISINAGYEESKKLNLTHHIGMVEEDAGYRAGKKMVKMATFSKARCWIHFPRATNLLDRCKGFEQAMNEMGIEYLGRINMPEDKDNVTRYVSAVEREVDESGGWDGHGILLAAIAPLSVALELKKLHPNFVMGSFDTNTLLQKSLATGDVLFGIGQELYLQGYLPVSILTHAVITNQTLLDHSIRSGQRFVIAPPTDEEAECEEQNFPVCPGKGKSMITMRLSPTVTAQPSSSMRPSVSPTRKRSSRPSLSMQPSASPTAHPSSSMEPSSFPSFDLRPTLEVVQERGLVRCGMWKSQIVSRKGWRIDLCRAIASVIFGSPDRYMGVAGTVPLRFKQLDDRDVDLLLYGDTHTIEREVRERTSGSGFTFSSPYNYDGLAYFGNETLVECAEKRKRYDECSSLVICSIEKTTGNDFMQSYFPSEFVKVVPNLSEAESMLWNGECNIVISDRSLLLSLESSDENRDRKYIVGDKMLTKEPLCIVTRNNNREFSDIVNWVVQALYYGEEQGLTKNSSLCQNYTNLTSRVSELNFLNAVHCVGNYGEIMLRSKQRNRGMNRMNNGTGMIYAIPYGDLEDKHDRAGGIDTTANGALFDGIRNEQGSLNCGVVVPDNFDAEVTTSDKIVGMSVDYCRTLAAALFHGNFKAVDLFTFSESNDISFAALNNGTINVLVGTQVEKKHDFGSSSSVKGVQYSTPYYYGNSAGDDVSFFSLATREDDPFFSSFVNSVALAPIYALENGIRETNSEEMPLVPIFGRNFQWALRDAIAYSGNYDQIYTKHFGDVAAEHRGRNMLNDFGGPQIHSFPGLSP